MNGFPCFSRPIASVQPLPPRKGWLTREGLPKGLLALNSSNRTAFLREPLYGFSIGFLFSPVPSAEEFPRKFPSRRVGFFIVVGCAKVSAETLHYPCLRTSLNKALGLFYSPTDRDRPRRILLRRTPTRYGAFGGALVGSAQFMASLSMFLHARNASRWEAYSMIDAALECHLEMLVSGHCRDVSRHVFRLNFESG